MEFCIISPTTGLEKYAQLSKTHLVLAQYLYNVEYSKFYRTRRLAGDFIILDNGAYENTRPLDNFQYLNFIESLQPKVIVLPDILMSPWRETTAKSLQFLDTFAEAISRKSPKSEFMFVPQVQRAANSAENLAPYNQWMKACATVLDDGRVGHLIKWIGLGRYMHTEFINLPGNGPPRRVKLMKAVRDTWGHSHVKFHALGMAAGDIEELDALREAGCNSIDSSAPVWRGWNGTSITSDPTYWKAKGTPCNINAELPDESAHQLILSNLEACGVNTNRV